MRSRRCPRAARPSLRVDRSRHPATVCPDGWSPPRYLVTRNRIRLTGQLARPGSATVCGPRSVRSNSSRHPRRGRADHASHLLGVQRWSNYLQSSARRASPRYSLPMIAGEKAPDFTLYDHTGRPRTLSTLLSDGPVVLFFFPIASSPICTAQACHFRDLSDEFARVGAQRVGISTDTVDRQAHFAHQRSFDYPLLSDADGVVSELFGVRRGRLAKLRRSVAAREAPWRGRHTRRRGLLARICCRSDGRHSSSTPTAPFSRSSPARCEHRCTPTRRCGS